MVLTLRPMSSLFKILKYTIYNIYRSWWSLLYFLFFLASTASLLYFSGDFTRAVSSLLNIILLIVPLVSIVFGTMFWYNSREFSGLLLAQPLRRTTIFLGQFLGLAAALVSSYCIGITVAFLIFGGSGEDFSILILLLVCGSLLTLIFLALSFLIAAWQDDRIRGFGLALLVWLITAVVYDGFFLMVLTFFQDYPLETPSVVLSLLNPMDLTRIMVLLQMDNVTLMGYTGAVFNKFFGTFYGAVIALATLIAWTLIPLVLFAFKVKRKDF